MINVKNLLITTIQNAGYNWEIIQQGSMDPGTAYPEHFFTFFNNESFDVSFYDNSENSTVWDFDLNVYSTDPDLANQTLRTLKPYLKAAGFICEGAGYDVISDYATHTGRGMNVMYIESV